MEKWAIGLHGWANAQERLWIPQAARLLKDRDYAVHTPEIDAPDDFDIDLWEKTVDGLIIPTARTNRKLVVFAHSNSGQFVLSSAAKLEEDQMIDVALLFAPYLILKEDDLATRNEVRYASSVRLFEFAKTIDLRKAGRHIKKTVLLFCEGERDQYINVEENMNMLVGGLQSDVDVLRIPRERHFMRRELPYLPDLLTKYLD